MSIKVKAIERNVAFEKGKQKWAFVMQADLYSQLNATKVIEEAAVRSGLPKAVINAGWAAIGDVIAAWATEGHSVAVPGLGSLRFGLNSTAVEVSANLITRRYIIFVPNTEIKKELEETSVNITCYDRNGKVVKQVTSTDTPPTTPSDGNTPSGGDNPSGGSDSAGGSGSQGTGSEGSDGGGNMG